MIKKEVFKNKCLIPYFTFGDPNTQFTESLIEHAAKSGADIIEIGFPFSDPIADGPVIQASHQRALDHNPDLNLLDALSMVKRLKTKISIPLVFMLSANLVFRFGISRFFQEAAQHHLDGVILPDLPIEESDDYRIAAKKSQIDIIFLVSPLCSDDRLKKIVKATSGFLYVISSTGTTGVRDGFSDSLQTFCDRIKKIRSIPLAIGFGISSPQHVKDVYCFSDGAIVGSFFTSLIASHIEDPEKAISAVSDAISAFNS